MIASAHFDFFPLMLPCDDVECDWDEDDNEWDEAVGGTGVRAAEPLQKSAIKSC